MTFNRRKRRRGREEEKEGEMDRGRGGGEDGQKAGRKEEKEILTYFWSLQTVLFRVVQKGGHVVIEFGLQTVHQVSENR